MEQTAIERERQQILEARAKGKGAVLGTYTKLSGPGWLQSAITLGGGSLSASLYLGVVGGLEFLWIQPLAMITGIIMLAAISYVALTTQQRAFGLVNRHINPVLGWGWIIATLIANLVFVMPQFTLTVAAFQQNLMPSVFGADAMSLTTSKIVLLALMGLICIPITFSYGSSGKGVKIFELVLKLMVALVVVSFVGVVVRLSFAGVLPWGQIFRGLIPDLALLSNPASEYVPFLDQLDAGARPFWEATVVKNQRTLIISAAAIAVGINMTFLMPYSLLKRGWDKEFRGLAIFDLATGMFIPFVLVTACIVIAAAAQFHVNPPAALVDPATAATAPVSPGLRRSFDGMLTQRLIHELGADQINALSDADKAARRAALPAADRRVAAMLANRDSMDLANSLTPLTGRTIAHILFGLGVIGMGISSAIMIMMINGFVLCEMFGRPWTGWTFRIGSLMPFITGCMIVLYWGSSAYAVFMPTSVLGMIMLPIAYLCFFLMMNNAKLLGADIPRGGVRATWNVLMLASLGIVLFASLFSIWDKAKVNGMLAFAGFVAMALVAQFVRVAARAKSS